MQNELDTTLTIWSAAGYTYLRNGLQNSLVFDAGLPQLAIMYSRTHVPSCTCQACYKSSDTKHRYQFLTETKEKSSNAQTQHAQNSILAPMLVDNWKDFTIRTSSQKTHTHQSLNMVTQASSDWIKQWHAPTHQFFLIQSLSTLTSEHLSDQV